MFKKTSALSMWLMGRNDFESGDLLAAIDKYEREIETQRVNAVQKMILILRGYKRECLSDINDETISKRERQMAKTELNRIKKEITRLESSITIDQRIPETKIGVS